MDKIPFPFTIIPQNEDEQFMLEALRQAFKAFLQEEVPVGAVLVKEGKVIARGYNQVELLQDATAHAEMLCITAGEAAVENWRLTNTVLYCTLEPCCMCAGALFLSRVSKVVYGAKDIRHGAHGSFVNLFDKKHPTHELEVKCGVLAEYSAELMKSFFEIQRNKAKK